MSISSGSSQRDEKIMGLAASIDFVDGKSFLGEPTTNYSYSQNSNLGHGYDWTNSGAGITDSNYTISEGLPGRPPGYKSNAGIHARRCTVTTVGSIHFAAGWYNGLSGSTVYSLSVWYWQNRAGVGGPYVRQQVNNNNLGSLYWEGNSQTGTSNWPARKWIRIMRENITTSSNETGLYISNYVGNTVGDTALYYGPQIEAKAYCTPLVVNSTNTAAAASRSATDVVLDRSGDGNHCDFDSNQTIGTTHSMNGKQLFLRDSTRSIHGNGFLKMDGTDDTFDVPVGIHTNNFTMSVWMCFSDVDSGNTGGILCWGWSGTYGRILYSNDKKLKVSLYHPPTQSVTSWYTTSHIGGALPISDNTVFHLIITANESGQWKIYCNGEFHGHSGAWNRNNKYAGGNTRIGFRDHVQSNDIGRARKYHKFEYYEKELTLKDVRKLYNKDKGKFGL